MKQSDLDQFIGTEHWYRHPLCRTLLFTDGIQFLAEKAGAFWLIDIVGSYQPDLKRESFQLWRLEKADKGAVVTCRRDTNTSDLVRQEIEYSDFPFDDLGDIFEWYVCQNDETTFVMLLKSEY